MKKYLDVYNEIKREIISGAIKFNEKLPSKRVTADKMNVSVITVEHAYELLESEGYVEAKERSGYFVAYTEGSVYLAQEMPTVTQKASGVTTLDEGIPFNTLAKAIRAVINDYGENIRLKSPNGGVWELKTAIMNYLSRNKGISVKPEQIVIGSGAEYLYGLIIELLDGAVFGLEEPSYRQIENVYKAKGAKYQMLSLTSSGIDSTALSLSNASVLHVTPFRSYPSGVSASASKKAEYLNFAYAKNGYVIEDDYDSEFYVGGKIAETIFAMDNADRVIYINTFSKTICGSMRLGYMILPLGLTEKFYEKLGFYSCTVPTLEQYLVAYLMDNGILERHINKIRRLRKSSRA